MPQHSPQPVVDEEPNDEIIGTAFRWSLLAFGLIGLLVMTIAFWPRKQWEETIIEKKTGDISTLPKQDSTDLIPEFRWQNIAPDCGIDFVHFSGATGERLLPETMGGGVAIFDFNNDGFPDVLFVSGSQWPESEVDRSATSSLRLYQNDGQARFTEVTLDAGLDCQLYGMSCAVGDFDNDGWIDLFVTCVGSNILFQNVEGRFTNVTQTAGVAGSPEEWSTAAGFFDFDRDGLLDLMVCNYIQWNRELDYQVNFTLNGVDRAYGPPTHYGGTHPRLYRNLGDGRFEDVTAQAGLQVMNVEQNIPLAKSLGLLLVDIDGDGWDDMVVANDTVRNQCFLNQRDGTFRESAVLAGLAYDRMGNATGAMGIDVAHPWNDDSKAIAIGNFANEMSSVYVSRGNDVNFVDQAAVLGIGAPTRQRLSFGTVWEDFDLDGRIDFLQVNGHLEDTISEIQPSQTYRQAAQLFWNNGKNSGVCFSLVDATRVGDLYQPIVGRGVATGDLNGDGRPDLVITQIDGPPLVLINQVHNDHRYLRVALDSGGSNRQGFGSVIQADFHDGHLATRYVSPTSSYLSQSEIVVTFGFGSRMNEENSDLLPLLKIRWPDGIEQTVRDIRLNQTLRIRREEQLQ